MRIAKQAAVLVFLTLAMLLLSSSVLPSARAVVNGPYSWWYDSSIWNNRYQGNTIYVDVTVYNTDSQRTYTITSLQLTTPWQTYTATDLPATVCFGCNYFHEFSVIIPSTQSVGTVSFTYRITGTSSAGGVMYCSPSTTDCSWTDSISITADPNALQNQITNLQQTVNSLDANITSLNSQITSLNSQLATAKNNITSLQSKISSYQSQISSLQGQFTAAQNNMTTLQGQVSSLQTQLSAAKNNITSLQNDVQSKNTQIQGLQQNLTATANALQKAKSDLADTSSSLDAAKASLVSTQAALAAAQSSLATVSNVYLPVGVAVPAIVAVLLLVLYVRKGSRPGSAMATAPQQTPSAMAPPGQTALGSKFCPNCGTANRPSSKFCSNCGTGLS